MGEHEVPRKPSFAVEEAKDYAALRRWAPPLLPGRLLRGQGAPPMSERRRRTAPAANRGSDGGLVEKAGGRRFAGAGLTIPSVLEVQAAERPDQAMLVIDDEPLTYRQLHEGSMAAAATLAGWASARETGWRSSWEPPPSG